MKRVTEYYECHGTCKKCECLKRQACYASNKEKRDKLLENPEFYFKPRLCDKCGLNRIEGEFRVNRKVCINCERQYGRKYNKDHHEVRTKWVSEHKDQMVKLLSDWYQKNKPSINQRYRERCANDPSFKVHRLEKDRLLKCIDKVKKTEDYLGTSFENVARWLEYNFIDGMTWENHGTVWDIDHVIPVSLWDLTNQDHNDVCFNWKNLTPLASNVNRHVKRNKIVMGQVTRHVVALERYVKEQNIDQLELLNFLIKYDQQLVALGETPCCGKPLRALTTIPGLERAPESESGTQTSSEVKTEVNAPAPVLKLKLTFKPKPTSC